ncbi:MAG: HK97 gp10 family phage protein [Alphaproteobacteria bacterium]|nr:HK97 gp10 family phage protein [Alphaproteobacteria bacterium]
MKLEFDLNAFDEMEKFCKDLPKKMQDKVNGGAMRAGAKVIKQEIEASAPSGSAESQAAGGKAHHKIKDSIVVKKQKEGNGQFSYVIGVSKKAYHAIFIEFGTRFISPKPFAVPAIERSKDEAIQSMSNAMFKGLQRESKKLAGDYFKSGLSKRRKKRKK